MCLTGIAAEGEVSRAVAKPVDRRLEKRQFLAGTNRMEGHCGRTEALCRADGHSKEMRGSPSPLQAQASGRSRVTDGKRALLCMDT